MKKFKRKYRSIVLKLLVLSFCLTILNNCISYPYATRPVKHLKGTQISGSAAIGRYEGSAAFPESVSYFPNLQAGTAYGFQNMNLTIGLNANVSIILSQADLYYNWLSSKHLNLGSGMLLGLVPGVYQLLGVSLAENSEIGLGFQYSNAKLFSPNSRLAQNAYHGWIQYWHGISQNLHLGAQIGYQQANNFATRCDENANGSPCPDLWKVPELETAKMISARISMIYRFN